MTRYGIPLIVAAVAALAAPRASRASFADVPLEILTTRAELIVVAEVLAVGEPVELKLRQPGMKQAHKGFFRVCSVKVTRVIKEKGEAPSKPVDRKIDVLTQTEAPPQPGAPRFASYFADLKPGEKYVLILRKLEGRDECFLPSYPKNLARASDVAIRQIAAAADTGKWKWGQAVKGLQMTVRLPNPEVRLVQSVQRPRLPNGKMGPAVKTKHAYLNPTIALRNNSRKAITISLYPKDEFLSFTVVGPGGVVARPNWYEYLARSRQQPFGPKNLRTIAPGEIVFVSPHGEATYGMGMQLELHPGKWIVNARYKVARKAKDAAGKPVWVGEVVTKAVEVTVKPLLHE